MTHLPLLRAATGAAFLAALSATPPAMAANFTPPAGCSLDLTVQNRGCTVAQVYRCDADPQGWQRTALFDRDGLYYLSAIDAETRWMESQSTRTGILDRLVENAPDDASFSGWSPRARTASTSGRSPPRASCCTMWAATA